MQVNPHLLLMLAGGFVAFFFAFFYFKHREHEQEKRSRNQDYRNKATLVLQAILLLGMFFGLYSVPKAAIDGSKACDFVAVNETTINNTTTKSYDYLCSQTISDTSFRLYERVLWLLRGFGFYLILHYLFQLYKIKDELTKDGKKNFRRIFGG